MSKPSKSGSLACAFCGRAWDAAAGVSRSDEHVLAQWMRTMIGPLPKQRSSVRVGFNLNEEATAYRESPTREIHSPASIMNLITREVCRGCNGGWMSMLEERARPHLELLFRAAQGVEQVWLDGSAAGTVARWAQKTVLTAEMTADQPWVGFPADRRTLMDGTAIARSPVWLGRLPESTGVFSAALRFGISDQWVPQPDDRVRSAIFHVLMLQNLLIAVYLPEVGGREMPHMDIRQWVRLWPCRREVDFPPMENLDHVTLGRLIQDHSGWLPMTAVRQIERSPVPRQVVRRN